MYPQLTGNAEDNSDGHCSHPAKNAFNLSVYLKRKKRKEKKNTKKTNKKKQKTKKTNKLLIPHLLLTRLQIVSETESNEIT